MIKRIFMLSMILVVSLAFVVAGPQKERPSSQTSATEMVRITHELGSVDVPTNPSRVVIFDLGALDILDTIGIDIKGIGRGATLPAHLAGYADTGRYPLMGSLHEPDIEQVYLLSPELILIGGRAAPAHEELSKIAPTVMITLPGAHYLATLASNVSIIASIFPEHEARLTAEMMRLKERSNAIKEQVAAKQLTALFLMVNAGSLSVFGEGSRFSVIYDEFGFTVSDNQIESSTHGQSASFEYLLKQNPDHLFVLDRQAAIGETEAGQGAQQLLNNALIRGMKTKITYVDPTAWYITSGGLTATDQMINDVLGALQ
ncbi:MAG: ABC transporter substrate-binding protein [Sphaerochaeta sp.]|jgi:iron complex transport system substrate-binding protein